MTIEQIQQYIPRSLKNRKTLCVEDNIIKNFLSQYTDFKWFRVYDKDNVKVVASIYFGLFKNKIFTSVCRVHEDDIFDQRIGIKIGINRLLIQPTEFNVASISNMLPKEMNQERYLKDLLTTFHTMGKEFISHANTNTTIN